MSREWHYTDESKLSIKEIEYFKKGTPEMGVTLLILKLAFGISWGIWMLFLGYEIFLHYGKEDCKDILVLFAVFLVLGIVFILSSGYLLKKNKQLYEAVKAGQYRVILTTISRKDYYYLTAGRRMFLVKVRYYECPDVNGKIFPITIKQYKKAKEGDRLKVITVYHSNETFGICDE